MLRKTGTATWQVKTSLKAIECRVTIREYGRRISYVDTMSELGCGKEQRVCGFVRLVPDGVYLE